MNRHKFILAAALALGANGASAATLVTSTVTAGPYQTDVANLPGNIVNRPLFNSNLGTLTAVSVSETGTFTGSALLENESPGPESFDFFIADQFGVDLSQDTDLPSKAATDLAATTFTNPLPTQHYDLAAINEPGANGNYGPFTTNWGGVISGLPVADFEAPGGGSVGLHVDAISFPQATNDVITINDVFYDALGGGPTATASLFAVYTYTPAGVGGVNPNGGVPEPSTWAMILLGFAGIAYTGCRRRKRAMGMPFAA
jgi:hypothetical protein